MGDYYAIKLSSHSLSITDLPDLTENILDNVGVRKQGHVMAILKYSRIIRKELARYEKKNNRKNTSDSDEMEDDESRRKSPDRKPKNTKTKAPVHLERKKMDKIKIDDQDLMTDSF